MPNFVVYSKKKKNEAKEKKRSNCMLKYHLVTHKEREKERNKIDIICFTVEEKKQNQNQNHRIKEPTRERESE